MRSRQSSLTACGCCRGAQLAQSLGPIPFIPLDPFVDGLAAYLMPFGNLADPFALQVLLDPLLTFPRHARHSDLSGPPGLSSSECYPCRDQSVTHVVSKHTLATHAASGAQAPRGLK